MQKLPFVVLLPILSSLSPSPQTVPEHPYYQLPTTHRKIKQQQVQYVQIWLAVCGCPYLVLIFINKIRQQVQFLQRKPAVLGCSGLLFETHMPTNIKIISEKYNKKRTQQQIQSVQRWLAVCGCSGRLLPRRSARPSPV